MLLPHVHVPKFDALLADCQAQAARRLHRILSKRRQFAVVVVNESIVDPDADPGSLDPYDHRMPLVRVELRFQANVSLWSLDPNKRTGIFVLFFLPMVGILVVEYLNLDSRSRM